MTINKSALTNYQFDRSKLDTTHSNFNQNHNFFPNKGCTTFSSAPFPPIATILLIELTEIPIHQPSTRDASKYLTMTEVVNTPFFFSPTFATYIIHLIRPTFIASVISIGHPLPLPFHFRTNVQPTWPVIGQRKLKSAVAAFASVVPSSHSQPVKKCQKSREAFIQDSDINFFAEEKLKICTSSVYRHCSNLESNISKSLIF